MGHLTSVRDRISVEVTYPDEWYATQTFVPNLVYPRELFGICTAALSQTPSESSQPRPMSQLLSPKDILIWCYYQCPDDPDPSNPTPNEVPDYSRYSFPLVYLESEVFPSTDAREWSPSDFLWRRVGFSVGDVVVTVWVWEGTSTDPSSLASAIVTVASVRPV